MFNKQQKNDPRPTPSSKEKKPFYKRTWFIILAGFFILSAVAGGSGDDAADEPEEPEVEEVADAKDEPEEIEDEPEEEIEEEPEPEPEPEEEEEPEEEPEPEPEAEEEFEDEAEDIADAAEEMQDEVVEAEPSGTSAEIELAVSFLQSQEIGDNATIAYDEGMEAITFLTHDEDLGDAFTYAALGMLQEEYAFMRDSFSYLSESIHDLAGVGFIILNPSNPDNILLWFYDGLVMYDYTTD